MSDGWFRCGIGCTNEGRTDRFRASRDVSFEMGGVDGGAAERYDNSKLRRDAGWANITLGERKLKCQIYRRRGTFATNTLITEREVQLIVDAFKLVTGFGASRTATDREAVPGSHG